MKAIVKAGAKVTYLDDVCRTPLMYACDTKQHGSRVALVRYIYIYIYEIEQSPQSLVLLNQSINEFFLSWRQILVDTSRRSEND